MKIKTAFFILTIFSISQVAFAGTPGHKFVRGIEGLVTSPFEYINQYQAANERQGLVASAVIGVFGGTAMTIKRILNGAYDLVSFPVNAPKDYGLLLADDSETALDAYTSSQNSGTFPLATQIS